MTFAHLKFKHLRWVLSTSPNSTDDTNTHPIHHDKPNFVGRVDETKTSPLEKIHHFAIFHSA